MIKKESYMPKFLKGLTIAFFAITAFSCVSNEKIIYLQNLEGNESILEDQLISYEIPEYRLQYNDILDVKIQTVEDMIENGFNIDGQQNNQMQVGAQGGGDVFYITGYTVDKLGNIRLPIVGEVNVKDKTVEEARLEIEKRLSQFVTSEVYVMVKLGGIRYSALGEFRRPGKFVVLQDRMTIFEAIANAGDLNTVAKRDEILLIRQYPEGTKLHRVNLNDRQLIESPFYFIQPNDQLYVEPMKVREIGAGENALQTIVLISSILTTALLVVNLFVN
jgi:polysaccharide export outer membrane protein